jgi:hypothetical protein
MTDARMLTVYDPTAEPRAQAVELAPRLASLAGRRAGILDNGKHNAGLLMSAVVERLRPHGVTEVVIRQKPVAGPPSPEVVADLSRCDFILVGSAD